MFNVMKNSTKRKEISRDASFIKDQKTSKKVKVDISAQENQSLNNWHEVKIILDATVVEKYLKKKPSTEVLKVTPKTNKSTSRHKKMLVPDVPQASESNSDGFSEKNDVRVKIEVPEDPLLDNFETEENLVFDNLWVKPEQHTPVQDAEVWDNGGFDKFAESVQEDSQCQDSEIRKNLPVSKFEDTLKNEILEVDKNTYDEVVVGQEFKHEEILINFNNMESIDQENDEVSMTKKTRGIRKRKKCQEFESIDGPNDEASTNKKTRSERKRKKCLDCDDCDHGVVNKCRAPSLVHKEQTSKVPVKSSNCSNKSKVLSKTSTTSLLNKHQKKIEVKVVSKRLKVTGKLQSEHCNYKASRRSYLFNHFDRYHSDIFVESMVPCTLCNKLFDSKEEMKKHKLFCPFFLICKYCLISLPSRYSMNLHLEALHHDNIKGMNYKEAIEEATFKLPTPLEQTNFERNFGRIRKYYLEKESEIVKLFCTNCLLIYDERKLYQCTNCETRLSYQCQKCYTFRSRYHGIWKHIVSESSDCSISNELADIDQKESLSSTNQVATTSNENNCQICDFKSRSRSQYYEHILNIHLDKGIFYSDVYTCPKCGKEYKYRYDLGNTNLQMHKELCGLACGFPCRFCPVSCETRRHLTVHISTIHIDEMDAASMGELIKEICVFRNIIKEENDNRFRRKCSGTENIEYHKGIESMLKPICFECKTNCEQIFEHCIECQKNLNFKCLQCDELFSKYSIAWEHITRTCKNRSFTLPEIKIREDVMKVNDDDNAKEKVLNLYFCDHCGFKNTNKTVLFQHIRQIHRERKELNCKKCFQSFYDTKSLNLHRLKCRVQFYYTCYFCKLTAMRFPAIKGHILRHHADQLSFFNQDTVEEILQEVMDSKKMNGSMARRLTKGGSLIKRNFSDNLKLLRLQCRKCERGISNKQILRGNHESLTCPWCEIPLKYQCKICEKTYKTWKSLVYHLQKNVCGIVEFANEDENEVHMDHTYASKKSPPEVLPPEPSPSETPPASDTAKEV